MWQMIVQSAHFLAEVALGILVIVGFVCWGWFIAGIFYYKNHKDLPKNHVLAEEHEGLRWWNGWRWSVSHTFRPLKDIVIIESSIFGVAAALALIWVLDLIFK